MYRAYFFIVYSQVQSDITGEIYLAHITQSIPLMCYMAHNKQTLMVVNGASGLICDRGKMLRGAGVYHTRVCIRVRVELCHQETNPSLA
jgi:hypothetical protein